MTHDFAFLCGLHKSHLLGVVQPDGPGILQAGNGGDCKAVITFVCPSEWPTPAHAIFRAGTRGTAAKYSQREISSLTNRPDYAESPSWTADGVAWSLPSTIMVPLVLRHHALKVAPLNPERQRIRTQTRARRFEGFKHFDGITYAPVFIGAKGGGSRIGSSSARIRRGKSIRRSSHHGDKGRFFCGQRSRCSMG